MLTSTLIVLSVSLRTTLAATECLVGCMLQDISPFDDDNAAVWDDRETCDSTTLGCDVSAINYPGTFFRGALWTQTSGMDGSDGCTCNLCDPYVSTLAKFYMSEEVSLWSRIQCYIAASEASGYDMSTCVAAVVDQGTLPCVDDVYEAPVMGQFECEDNSIEDIESSLSISEACIWSGDNRQSAEMFVEAETPATDTLSPAPTSPMIDTTPSPVVVPTSSPGTNAASPVSGAGDNPTPAPADATYPTPAPSPAADNPPATLDVTPMPVAAPAESSRPTSPAPISAPVESGPTTPEGTCTSVTVSGIGEYDGTYEYQSPGYYARAGGTITYEIQRSDGYWYIETLPSTVVPQYRTNDPAEHPADITLEWAECVATSCENKAAALQPVITCGDSESPTPYDDETPSPSPSPIAADDDETPSPSPPPMTVDEDDDAGGEAPQPPSSTPAPVSEASNGGGSSFSTDVLAGTIAGVVAGVILVFVSV